MRLVTWLIAASVVQHSNIVSCAGTGTLWKWSYTQSESRPSSSASLATSTAFAHFACGSSMEASSIFQPWGTNTPKVRSCDMDPLLAWIGALARVTESSPSSSSRSSSRWWRVRTRARTHSG